MRGLFHLLLALCLSAGLATGAVSHAADMDEHGAPTAAADGQHSDGDHDRVPADTDKTYPHHHSTCHGHDLTAAMRACGPGIFERPAVPRPAAEVSRPGGSPPSPLRPPIA
jgi:hypothetical protein